MGIIFFLFLLGVMFIIVGYTHQKTPSCDKGLKMKLVNRDEFSKISGYMLPILVQKLKMFNYLANL